jgi:thymidylate synthase (FAD)
MNVKLISYTKTDSDYVAYLAQNCDKNDLEFLKAINEPEALMMYIARVSSPNQKNPTYEKLLKYCMDHGHWSVFEQVDATVEIETSLDVATQILRHRSFTFQQLSRRYSGDTPDFEIIEPRGQDVKNRQNSIDNLPKEVKKLFQSELKKHNSNSTKLYKKMLSLGIAKENARSFLPQNTTTKLYMKGSLRSWLHYLKVRTDPSTQKEHREVALAVQKELVKVFPKTFSAFEG